MSENEKYYFNKFNTTKEVAKSDCYMSGNCGTCKYCRSYDSNFHEFENDYCTVSKKEK